MKLHKILNPKAVNGFQIMVLVIVLKEVLLKYMLSEHSMFLTVCFKFIMHVYYL